ISFVNKLISKIYSFEDPSLEVQVFNRSFKNPIGLAAGFDKNAEMIPSLTAIGFGHIEVGTITSLPQEGNSRPRIFRLKKDHALINSMGFPSSGKEEVVSNLSKLTINKDLILGINIGKNKLVSIDDAASNYIESFNALKPFADYFVLNISSPNTPELRKLQEKDRLKELISKISENNEKNIPLLIKIAPDLTDQELDDIVEVSLESKISALIATNTTFSRENLKSKLDFNGGLSGKPLREKSLEFTRKLSSRLDNKIPIIAVGGIFNSEDVIDSIRAGASLVQLYTSLTYKGAALINKINRDLFDYLKKEKIHSIQDLIGIDS
ncbi:UNVERIFIED_CONTAM: hypothetical protein GTU68_048460, partial [Idotea baltica]|nr:hypothetical protein [Idotea baltica]